MRSPIRAFATTALAGWTACAVTTTSTFTETTVRTQQTVDPVLDSLEYNVATSIDGASIALSVSSAELCRTTRAPVTRRTEHVSRSDGNAGPFSRPMKYAFGGAAFGVFGGASLYIAEDAESPTTVADRQAAGGILLAIGAGCVVAAVIDAVRLRDTVRDAGEVVGASTVTEATCNASATADTSLVLAEARSGWRVEGRTDRDGVMRASLLTLPEQAFGDDGVHLSLNVGQVTMQVDIEPSKAAELLAALAAKPASTVAIARETLRTQVAKAERELAACQAVLDSGDLDATLACWRDGESHWKFLDADPRVETCLLFQQSAQERLATCVAGPEKTDADVIAKSSCLADKDLTASACGPLRLAKFHETRDTSLGVKATATRVATKITAIHEAAYAALAAAKAEEKRCLGPNVLAVVAQVQIGNAPDAKALRGCTYQVVPGKVETTTRDGWVIVSFGSTGIAYKTKAKFADGAYFRPADKAVYTGITTFARTDGGTFTMPAFKLSR